MKLQPEILSKQIYVYSKETCCGEEDFTEETFDPKSPCEQCSSPKEEVLGAYTIDGDPNSIGLCARHIKETYPVILNKR